MKAIYMNISSCSARLVSYRAATLLCVLIFLFSCTTIAYQGDGKFVDRGPFEGKDRYVVNLGDIDLGKTGQYKYVIGNLPSVSFLTGLEIVDSEPNYPGKRPSYGGRVRLMLETEAGQRVFNEDAPLDDWGWSVVGNEARSFLYRFGTRALDQGSGSSFVPRPGAKYRLTLEVVEPQSSPRQAHLLLKGGGWQ